MLTTGKKKLQSTNENMVFFKWSIEIDHYRQTFLKKPGALANSVALLQATPELKKIYTNYYIQREKDFIELLEIISANGLDKIIQAIDKLESISPKIVNTDKIKLLVQRDEPNKVISLTSKRDSQTEAYSKDILANYAAILNFSSQEEVKII